MTTIKLKNGSGAPTAGDLVQGEPALDLTNKRLYTEDSGGTVIEVGTNPSTINIDAGTIDGAVIGGSSAAAITGTTITGTSFVSSGNMTFGDNDKAIFGAGSDLEIFHSGTHSIIRDNGTGDLRLEASDDIFLRSVAGETYARFRENLGVELYYDNNQKFTTTSTGIDVTGSIVASGDLQLGSDAVASNINALGDVFVVNVDSNNNTGGTPNIQFKTSGNEKLRVSPSGIDVTGVITTDGMTTSDDINFGDDDKALFGAGNDLKIYHSANNQSYIHEAGTGDLNILASNFKVQNGAGTENKIVANTDGAVSLYYDNTARLTTTSSGIDVTGTVTADGLTVDGAATLTGNITQATGDLLYSGGGNWDIAHTIASQNIIFKTTPSGGSETQRIRVSHNGDISFYEDTGTTAKLLWSASNERLTIPTLTISDGSITTTAAAGDHTVFNSTGADADFRVRTGANTHSLYVEGNTGNVGIGTSSPARQFHVHDASASYLHLTNNTTGSTADDGASISMAGTSLQISNRENGVLQMYTNGSEAMRIDSSGNLLVGTSTD